MIHILKIAPEYYEEVVSGNKTFEIRKNDRDYRVGDEIILRCFKDGEYLLRPSVQCLITYITNYEQKDDYVVLSIKIQSNDSCPCSEIEKLSRELDFSDSYYTSRLEAIREYLEKNNLPTKEFFAILANGRPSSEKTSLYTQKMNSLIHKNTHLKKKCEALKSSLVKEVDRLAIGNIGYPYIKKLEKRALQIKLLLKKIKKINTGRDKKSGEILRVLNEALSFLDEN